MVPDKLVLQPGQKHRLQLIAKYNDGTIRDVTRLGVFVANNTLYADVDDEGLVDGRRCRARPPSWPASNAPSPPPASWSSSPTPSSRRRRCPQDNFIDRHVVDKLNRLKITPSPLAGDEEFLRRVYLDLIGVQPKPDEIRAFLADKDADETRQGRRRPVRTARVRRSLVAQVGRSAAEFAQHAPAPPSVYLFREFIRGAVASNMPLDEFARKILTARGGAVDDPASVYFAISKDTNDTLERVTQVFCGVRMLCARCHTHPLENWTQADYYGLASFFNQVTRPARTAASPACRTPSSSSSTCRPASPTNPRTRPGCSRRSSSAARSRSWPPAPTAARPTPAG